MSTIRFVLFRLIDFYELVIVAECILSWFASSGGLMRDIYEALNRLTEPFVGIFRRFIPMVGVGGMGIDISPMIAILVLDLIKRVLLRL